MASLRGLAKFAQQQQIMGDALIVLVGGVQRCMVAEMAPNRLAQGNVPQIRFICDGYCGLSPSRPSKACRTIDRQAVSTAPIAAPPGFVRVAGGAQGGAVVVSTPYRSGGTMLH